MKTSIRLKCVWFVFSALVPCVAVAQAPLLEVSTPVPAQRLLPSGSVARSWKALLSNSYKSPVTAYALSFEGNGRHGAIFDDAIPGREGLRPQLPPGQTASVTIPGASAGPSVGPPSCVVTAVIYADGATGGQPAVVARLLRTRAVFLAELPATIARLQAIAADPGASPDLVLDHFQLQEQWEIQALQDGSRPHVVPRVAGSVVNTLKHMTQQSLQQSAAGLAQSFTRWQIQLQQSLPKPPTLSLPPLP